MYKRSKFCGLVKKVGKKENICLTAFFSFVFLNRDSDSSNSFGGGSWQLAVKVSMQGSLAESNCQKENKKKGQYEEGTTMQLKNVEPATIWLPNLESW